MFPALAEAIETLEIPLDSAAITCLSALSDRLHAKLTAAVGAFDAEGLWELDAATSMTAWLRQHAGQSSTVAARLTTRGKRFHAFPTTAAAVIDGHLSGGQLDAILSNVPAKHVDKWAEHEAAVIPTLIGLSIEDTSLAMQRWRLKVEHDDEAPTEPDRSLHWSRTLDGRGIQNGSYDAEAAEIIDTALRLATTRDVDGDPPRTPAQRRADAEIDIHRFYLDNQHTKAGGRHRPHMNLVIDLEALEQRGQGQFLDGVILDETSMERLLCDANLHRVIVKSRSTILDYGRTIHTVPAPLFNAIAVRDRHCRFPGCDRKPKWCEGHHIWHWAHGGPTRIDNLVLLCSRHHHRLHQPGWHAKLKPDGEFEITFPDGRTLSSHPPNLAAA